MNYIPKFAEMLGIKIGEKFKIVERYSDCIYFFTNDGLCCNMSYGQPCDESMRRLLNGTLTIAKMPSELQKNEKYYFPFISNGKADYDYSCWNNNEIDFYRYNTDLVCFTKEEALENKENAGGIER